MTFLLVSVLFPSLLLGSRRTLEDDVGSMLHAPKTILRSLFVISLPTKLETVILGNVALGLETCYFGDSAIARLDIVLEHTLRARISCTSQR